MSMIAVLVAGLTPGRAGLGLGRAFGKRSGLSFGGLGGGFELAAELVASALQLIEGVLELVEAEAQRVILRVQALVVGAHILKGGLRHGWLHRPTTGRFRTSWARVAQASRGR
jgi:alkanesulfonate monooxygenase SsuD/methylene tetrahydromethanopterin reductase-like flavin-dependent oxidoreductase (luciferase family)